MFYILCKHSISRAGAGHADFGLTLAIFTAHSAFRSRVWAAMRRRFGRREVLLALFYLPLRKLLFRPLGLDELGGVAHRKSAEFFTLGAKQRCAGAGIASVTPRVERTHPVLVSAGIVGPVLARQKRQAFVAGAMLLVVARSNALLRRLGRPRSRGGHSLLSAARPVLPIQVALQGSAAALPPTHRECLIVWSAPAQTQPAVRHAPCAARTAQQSRSLVLAVRSTLTVAKDAAPSRSACSARGAVTSTRPCGLVSGLTEHGGAFVVLVQMPRTLSFSFYSRPVATAPPADLRARPPGRAWRVLPWRAVLGLS